MADRLNKDKPLLLERPWMRPLKLGKPLKHRQALVARSALDNVKAIAVTKQVPHLRCSQPPPCLGEGRGRRIYMYICNHLKMPLFRTKIKSTGIVSSIHLSLDSLQGCAANYKPLFNVARSRRPCKVSDPWCNNIPSSLCNSLTQVGKPSK